MPGKVFNRKSITRLSRYRRALMRLKELGFTRVVSATLGEEVGVTAAQIRKDFSHYGLSGNKKGGYQIKDLLKQLHSILGKDRLHRVILAGVGSIGTALLNYKVFQKEKIQIVAAFDADPSKVNRKNGVPILPLSEMHEYVKWNGIKIGIISTPAISAQEICDAMIAAGIEGILNFAPRQLKVPDGTVIMHVDVTSKLESIIYFVDGFGKNA
jgi:redox-sensing transcriptional repressor